MPDSKSKPKSKFTSPATKPRNSAPRPKSPPKSISPVVPASRLIDQRIRDVGGWRGETLARMRALILEAEPRMIEECKWVKPTNPSGVPVWSHNGIVCTGETYKEVVKLTFAKGASLPDPSRLFNSSLEGNTRRAIDIREGEKVDARAFRALIKAAGAQNSAPPLSAKNSKPGATETKLPKLHKNENGVVLLSGGNPQIAKADGDAPVQAYIAAMPGWKSVIGRWLDALIARNVPNLRKAVKWNSPFYGVQGKGFFLGVHCLTKYVKITFFQGKSLEPIPPGGTPKSGDSRWIDIYENDELDDVQMATWIKQAAALRGWDPGGKS